MRYFIAYRGDYNPGRMLGAMIPESRVEKIAIEIDDIIQSKGRGVQVLIKRTGKPCWLPASRVDFMKGRVVIPVWLAKKIGNGNIKESG